MARIFIALANGVAAWLAVTLQHHWGIELTQVDRDSVTGGIVTLLTLLWMALSSWLRRRREVVQPNMAILHEVAKAEADVYRRQRDEVTRELEDLKRHHLA